MTCLKANVIYTAAAAVILWHKCARWIRGNELCNYALAVRDISKDPCPSNAGLDACRDKPLLNPVVAECALIRKIG